MKPEPQTFLPKPYTLNPGFQTLNPDLYVRKTRTLSPLKFYPEPWSHKYKTKSLYYSILDFNWVWTLNINLLLPKEVTGSESASRARSGLYEIWS
jgi:hypothetical protein